MFFHMTKEQALIILALIVGVVFAIWFTGAFAGYVINKLSNKKGRKDKLDNNMR